MSTSRLAALAAALLLAASSTFAGNDHPEPVAHLNASASAVSWQPGVDHDKIVLVVVSPDGTLFTKEFGSGTLPSFRLQDLSTRTPDGAYAYELRVIPRVSPEVKRQLAAARAADDDAAVARIEKANGLANSITQSGTLTVVDGSFINSDADDRVMHATTTAHGRVAPLTTGITGDTVIEGKACIGVDCSMTETFGSETLKLKDQNTRLLFQDTSATAGFPNNNWMLVANDSQSGGANQFSLQDVTNNRVPFTVTAGAPNASMFVASNGKVGFGTAAPMLNVHIATGDTPAIRQEQTSASGFTAHTWDIGANEANWFVRDVTGGSHLPLRIRPGAPTSSVDISASGNVGVGTSSPGQRLHVFQNADVNTFIESENSSNTANADAGLQAKSDTAAVNLQAHATARTLARWGQTLGGWNELIATTGNGLAIGTLSATKLILGTAGRSRLQIDGSTGAVTISGNISVTGTKNFVMPDPHDESQAIYYAALEGPEAGTYVRGTAKTHDGVAVINLPDYFSSITEKERMTVQLTPIGAPVQLYVDSRSPERIVVKSGGADAEFDYFVQGIRKGYLDYQVRRPNTIPR